MRRTRTATRPAADPTVALRAEGLRLRARLRYLYHGSSPLAVRFRLAVIVIDFAIIGFFLAAPILHEAGQVFYVIDYVIAAILILDLAARAYAHTDWKDWLKKPATWVDLFVLATLLFPAWLFNLGFLRLLRLWTLLNSDFFWRTVGRKYDDTRVEEITRALASLVTFIFVVTGFVYSSFLGSHPGISGYLDALYFTVATLTTTGFGDILLFREYQRRPVSRSAVAAIATQLDPMKRIRGNGGPRSVLKPERVAILSGKYHADLALKLGLPRLYPDEFVSMKPRNDNEFDLLRSAKLL